MQVVESYIPLFISIIKGGSINPNDFKADGKYVPYAVSALNIANRFELQDPSLPENSVAVIPIQGVMTGDKTMQLQSYVQQAEQNDNIVAIVLLVNSPGGMVFYTDITAATIANCSKPVVSYVLQMACSAAQWLISGSDKIIVSSQLDYLGSIGVMMSFNDYAGLLKNKLGVDIYEIYATKSSRKNEMSRALKNVNLEQAAREQLIIKDLDFTNEVFHSAIKSNLNIAEDSEVFSGATFMAAEAIKLGLAHEINPDFGYAIETAYKLGLTNKIKSIINQNN